MQPFSYTRPRDIQTAVDEVASHPGVKFIAGGTNLIDLMKLGVEKPQRVVDITGLSLNSIEETPDTIRIGALMRNSDLAQHPLIKKHYPLLSQAILAGASPQLRNMATVGGNLMQRTRCYYFNDVYAPCNKREPGSGCSALSGQNRLHAILGTSEQCIATHPSDMCVALAVFDAVIQTQGPHGERRIPITDFYLLPADAPERETILENGELIVTVDLPKTSLTKQGHYLKVRDRASYAFALVAVAAALEIVDRRIKTARTGFRWCSNKTLACI